MTIDTTIDQLRQRFIEDMTARQRGPASQKSHLRAYKRFSAWLQRSPDTATADEVRQFQLHLAETGVSITTRNATMSGIKFLFRVALRRHDLVAEIYHLNEPQKVALILNQDEMQRLLTMAGCLRDRLLLSLGYGAGLRAGEVLRLRVKHIDSEQSVIRVQQSKGRKDRLVMLSPEMLTLLREWWTVRPKRWDAGLPVQERLLFPGRTTGQPLSTHQLNRVFHEAAKAAGIRKAVNLHSLRHSFATHLFDRGVDIRTIQALLETTSYCPRTLDQGQASLSFSPALRGDGSDQAAIDPLRHGPRRHRASRRFARSIAGVDAAGGGGAFGLASRAAFST